MRNFVVSNLSAWDLAALVTTVLAWMALGHTGPDGTEKFALLPFQAHIQRIQCVIAYDECKNLIPVIKNLLYDFLGNIVVFMPFGMVVSRALRMYPRVLLYTALLGMGLSIIFETVQVWIPGRVVATDDVWLNTVGAWLGGIGYIKIYLPYRRLVPQVED